LKAAGIKVPGGSAGVVGATGKLPPAVADPVAAAFAHTFWWSFFAILLAFVPTLFLPNHAPVQTLPARGTGATETDGDDGPSSGPRVAGAMLD
jgi:hypothetical protein